MNSNNLFVILSDLIDITANLINKVIHLKDQTSHNFGQREREQIIEIIITKVIFCIQKFALFFKIRSDFLD